MGCSSGKCHHEHHGHDESCENKHSECCGGHCSSGGCHGHHHGHGGQCHGGCCDQEEKHGGITTWLYALGDCAWKEALREEIKKQIVSSDGDRIKELAKIVAESNGQRWKLKKEKKKHCKDLEEKLCGFFEKSKK